MKESNPSVRFNNFLKLSRSDKIAVVLSCGVLLERIPVGGKVCALFGLHDFYVELTLTDSAVEDVRAFVESGERMDKYLGEIDLSDLNDSLQPEKK